MKNNKEELKFVTRKIGYRHEFFDNFVELRSQITPSRLKNYECESLS